MSYLSWFNKHAKKHKKLVEKLKSLGSEEIIEYFDYENISKKEPWFCPLFLKGKRCHDIESLNCYLCACPNFRFCDDGFGMKGSKILKSYCKINSKNGKIFESGDQVHQDCSSCLVPHRVEFIKKVFKRDWKEIMRDCNES